jgi:hypothetical protein
MAVHGQRAGAQPKYLYNFWRFGVLDVSNIPQPSESAGMGGLVVYMIMNVCLAAKNNL